MGSPSGSVPPKGTYTLESSVTTTDCAVATGARLGCGVGWFGVTWSGACGAGAAAVIVIETVAGLDAALPSCARNVNESVPLTPGAGVYTSWGAEPLRLPRVGGVTMLKVRGSPSTSAPLRAMPTGWSWSVVTEAPAAVGASFTGVTVMETVAAPDSALPSETVY